MIRDALQCHARPIFVKGFINSPMFDRGSAI